MQWRQELKHLSNITALFLLGTSPLFGNPFLEQCRSEHKSKSQVAFFTEAFNSTGTNTCEQAHDAIVASGHLRVASPYIQNLSPIQGMTTLTSLEVASGVLDDLRALRTLANLEYLVIEEAQDVSLAPIAEHPRLTGVSLKGTASRQLASHLEVLKSLPALEALNLDGVQVDAHAQAILGEFVKLRTLAVAGDPLLTQINFVEGMVQLEELFVSDTNVKEISPIMGLSRLIHVDLSGTLVRDFSPLQTSKATLRALILHKTLVQDFELLRELRNLRFLWLSALNLSQIPDLSGNPKLKFIGLNHNRISDLTPLLQVPKLLAIQLDGNLIRDVSLLKDYSSLENFWLADNPLGTTVAKTEENCPTTGKSMAIADFCQPQ